MGFLDKVLGKKHVMIAVTELGKQKVEQAVGADADFKILSDVCEYGSSSLREISERTGMSEVKVKAIVQRLKAEQKVRYTTDSQ